MLEVINLALPFFGLIFLGLGCGKFKAIPDAGLAWMDFFILYVALPALFYRIVAQTPLEQLANPRFIVGYDARDLVCVRRVVCDRHDDPTRAMAEATIAGLAGGYGNIGYMGPGLALATLGSEATAPVALIFCFDNILLFSLVPFLMTLAGREKKELCRRSDRRDQAGHVASSDARHHVRGTLGRNALRASCRARSFDAVPAECGGANSPVHPRRHCGAASARQDAIDVPFAIAVKLLVHPVLAFTLLSLLGPFTEVWIYTAVLMAALPPH